MILFSPLLYISPDNFDHFAISHQTLFAVLNLVFCPSMVVIHKRKGELF
jgi:hypothetical protein